VGAANVLFCTSSSVSRNENDSELLLAKTTWRFVKPRTIFLQSRKILNLCEKSKHASAVTIHATAQN